MKAVTTSNIFAKAQRSLKGLPHGFDKICFHGLVKQTDYSLNNAQTMKGRQVIHMLPAFRFERLVVLIQRGYLLFYRIEITHP